MGYLIINGDARRLPIDLSTVDAVVSDPPYGIGWNTNYLRFKGSPSANRHRSPVIGDDQPFDPRPWIKFDKVILWGGNCFSQHLPLGSWLVWDKRFSNGTSWLADAELAWMRGGHGTYIFAETCQGFVRPERIDHPTQKPISVMRWCIQKLKLPPNSLILDPYMGSGTTIIAAVQEGHRAIGIEIDPRYCEIARRRLERPHAAPLRPERVEHHPLFDLSPAPQS